MSTLREPASTPRRSRRDPMGKQALFGANSPPPVEPTPAPALPRRAPAPAPQLDDAAAAEAPVAPVTRITPVTPIAASRPASTPAAPRFGMVTIECSSCGHTARLSYPEFVLANLPVGVWLPIPGRRHNRFLRCPSCERRTWVQARWLT